MGALQTKSRPVIIACVIIDILAMALLTASLALPYWISVGSNNTSFSRFSGNYGLYRSCVSTSTTSYCTATGSSTYITVAQVLATVADGGVLIAVIIGIIYLLNQLACGKPIALLIVMTVFHAFSVLTGGAALGIVYVYFMRDINNYFRAYIGFAGYIYIAGTALVFIALILTFVEIFLQRRNEPLDETPPPTPPKVVYQRQVEEESSVAVDDEKSLVKEEPPSDGKTRYRWPIPEWRPIYRLSSERILTPIPTNVVNPEPPSSRTPQQAQPMFYQPNPYDPRPIEQALPGITPSFNGYFQSYYNRRV